MRVLALAASSAGLLMSVLATPVGAVDAADYLVWRFANPGPRGLGLIKVGNGTMTLEAIGMSPSNGHSLVISSSGCAKNLNAANTIESHSFSSDLNGAKYLKLELENTLVSSFRSVRLFQGSTQVDCGTLTAYSLSSGANTPSESLSINFFRGNGVSFASVIEVENDETHWVGHDFMPSKGYRAVATKAKCPAQPSAFVLENTWISSVKGTVYGDQATSLDGDPVHSLQIFRGSTRVACSKSVTVYPI